MSETLVCSVERTLGWSEPNNLAFAGYARAWQTRFEGGLHLF